MTLIEEIHAEVKRYEAEDQTVSAICMNLATLIRLVGDNTHFFNEAMLIEDTQLFGHKITVINEIPTGEFVISSRDKNAVWTFAWDRSGLWSSYGQQLTTTNNPSFKIRGTFTNVANWTQPLTVTQDVDLTPKKKKNRGRVNHNKSTAGQEREKKNWKHQNKRAK